MIRSSAPDPQVIGHLSAVLARARTRATGTRTTGWAGVVDFFARRFPAALYRTRAWWLTVMLTSYAVTAVMMWWLLDHPQVESALLDPQQVRKLVDNDFAGYYQESAASHFAAQVWTNNAWVAALCVAFGILGLPVIYVLFQNVANLALIGSIMIRHDRTGLFFGLILPHGLLELTAVFIAAGVGLRLFWAWVAPWPRTRTAARPSSSRSLASRLGSWRTDGNAGSTRSAPGTSVLPWRPARPSGPRVRIVTPAARRSPRRVGRRSVVSTCCPRGGRTQPVPVPGRPRRGLPGVAEDPAHPAAAGHHLERRRGRLALPCPPHLATYEGQGAARRCEEHVGDDEQDDQPDPGPRRARGRAQQQRADAEQHQHRDPPGDRHR